MKINFIKPLDEKLFNEFALINKNLKNLLNDFKNDKLKNFELKIKKEDDFIIKKLKEKEDTIEELLMKMDNITKNNNNSLKNSNLDISILENLEENINLLKEENEKNEEEINNLRIKNNNLEEENLFLMEKEKEFLKIVKEKNDIINNINKNINNDLQNSIRESIVIDSPKISNTENNSKITKTKSTQVNNIKTGIDKVIQCDEFINVIKLDYQNQLENSIIDLKKEKIEKYETENILSKKINELQIKIKSYELFIKELKAKYKKNK